jgi:hypothetical protein
LGEFRLCVQWKAGNEDFHAIEHACQGNLACTGSCGRIYGKRSIQYGAAGACEHIPTAGAQSAALQTWLQDGDCPTGDRENGGRCDAKPKQGSSMHRLNIARTKFDTVERDA